VAGIAALAAAPAALGRPAPPAAGPGALASELRALVERSEADATLVGVAVLDEDGTPRALLNADTPLKPASNLKVLTTAAGIVLLGAEHEYLTRLVASAPIVGGKVAGDVVVEGTGDPNISGRFHDGDPLAVFRTWARKLREAGLVAIEGDLVADDSFFDSVRFLPGWDPRHAGRWFSAEVSPLSLNDNCVDIRVVPSRPGESARVEVSPASPFVTVAGAPVTVAGRTRDVRIHRAPGTNHITVSGRIGTAVVNWSDHVAIEDPALFFAHTLAKVLEEAGVRILGKVRRITAEEVAAATAKGALGAAAARGRARHVLVEHRSKLLLDLPVINKRSQNLHAEILLKALGRAQGGDGSVAAGARSLERFLREQKIDAAGLAVADGSGLAHENRATARQLARTLHALRAQACFTAFRDSLPLGGVDGSLDDRFRKRRDLVGRVWAKTGTIRGVSALSGYVERDGIVWSFSVLVNSLPGASLGRARELEELIVERVFQSMASASAP
jgi:D-alanyl-D-alanine carboxypeptidase/D-alanyl-D-alanine-endopeptidase (penicillin-binding protein 4)